MRRKYKLQFFTESEAWTLFRVAAFGEAIGWTLLISGLAIKHYLTPRSNIPVLIAGQMHGTLFLIYLAAVFMLWGSLHWRKHTIVIAGLVSIPPYGTLIFEQWMSRQRRHTYQAAWREIWVYGVISKKDEILLAQPVKGTTWCLPGGKLEPGDISLEKGLERILEDRLGITPITDGLSYVYETHNGKLAQIHFLFNIVNGSEYTNIVLTKTKRGSIDFDTIDFTKPEDCQDLEPTFLRDIKLSKKTVIPFIPGDQKL